MVNVIWHWTEATLDADASVINLAVVHNGTPYTFQPGYLLPILRAGLYIGQPKVRQNRICPVVEHVGGTFNVIGALAEF